jgi:hypothetical protein
MISGMYNYCPTVVVLLTMVYKMKLNFIMYTY